MKRLLLAVLFVLGLAVNSYAAAAGACTPLIETIPGSDLQKVTFTCVASAGGAVSEVGSIVISGTLVAFEYDVGATCPDDLFDVEILDGTQSGGLDILKTFGANLPNGTDTAFTHSVIYRSLFTVDGGYMPMMNKTLTPSITNAGAASNIILYLYFIK